MSNHLSAGRLWEWMHGDNEHGGRRVRWRMFWVGFIVRLFGVYIAHTYRFRTFDDHFDFGWEMGRVGRALATGRGFSDPFEGHTGPTAWFPPLYPLLIAGVFKIFGVYTQVSATVLFAINSVFSAATSPAVYEIGERSFNRRVALWAGWLWALYPAATQYAVHWIWDMAITSSLFAWVIVLALRSRNVGDSSLLPPAGTEGGDHPLTGQTAGLWAAFGLIWGVIGLLNASVLTFLPFCALWMMWPERHRLKPTLTRATLAAVICAMCIAPWIVRNWVAFHAFIPIRANLGCEVYMSSLESNNGFPWGGAVSIFEATPEMQRYKQMGELAFCRERGSMGRAIFDANPGRFRAYTLKRIWFFWGGVPHPFEKSVFIELAREANYCTLSLGGLLGLALALHRRRPAAVLFAGAFLFLPMIYYFVTVQARFRASLEPLIFVLTVYLFERADRTRAWSLGQDSAVEDAPRKIVDRQLTHK